MIPFDHLALVANGAVTSGQYEAVKIRKAILGRLWSSEHCAATWSNWSTTLVSLLYKELFTYLGASACEKDFKFPTHLEAMEVLPGNISRETSSLCILWPHLSLMIHPRKELIHMSRDFVFFNCCWWTPPDLPVLRTAVYDGSFTGLYTF